MASLSPDPDHSGASSNPSSSSSISSRSSQSQTQTQRASLTAAAMSAAAAQSTYSQRRRSQSLSIISTSETITNVDTNVDVNVESDVSNTNTNTNTNIDPATNKARVLRNLRVYIIQNVPWLCGYQLMDGAFYDRYIYQVWKDDWTRNSFVGFVRLVQRVCCAVCLFIWVYAVDNLLPFSFRIWPCGRDRDRGTVKIETRAQLLHAVTVYTLTVVTFLFVFIIYTDWIIPGMYIYTALNSIQDAVTDSLQQALMGDSQVQAEAVGVGGSPLYWSNRMQMGSILGRVFGPLLCLGTLWVSAEANQAQSFGVWNQDQVVGERGDQYHYQNQYRSVDYRGSFGFGQHQQSYNYSPEIESQNWRNLMEGNAPGSFHAYAYASSQSYTAALMATFSFSSVIGSNSQQEKEIKDDGTDTDTDTWSMGVLKCVILLGQGIVFLWQALNFGFADVNCPPASMDLDLATEQTEQQLQRAEGEGEQQQLWCENINMLDVDKHKDSDCQQGDDIDNHNLLNKDVNENDKQTTTGSQYGSKQLDAPLLLHDQNVDEVSKISTTNQWQSTTHGRPAEEKRHSNKITWILAGSQCLLAVGDEMTYNFVILYLSTRGGSGSGGGDENGNATSFGPKECCYLELWSQFLTLILVWLVDLASSNSDSNSDSSTNSNNSQQKQQENSGTDIDIEDVVTVANHSTNHDSIEGGEAREVEQNQQNQNQNQNENKKPNRDYRPHLLVLTSFLTGLCLLSLAIVAERDSKTSTPNDPIWVLCLMLVLKSAFLNVRWPAHQSLYNESIRSEDRGFWNGVKQANSLGFGAVFVGGLLIDWYSYGVVFCIAGVITVLSGVVALPLCWLI